MSNWHQVARTGLRLANSIITTTRNFSVTRPYNEFKVTCADNDLIPLKNRFSLTGRNYIVTGGARGIGYAAVRAIAESGGNISILDAASRPVDDFANLSHEFGIKAKFITTDITDEKSLKEGFAQAMEDFGTLDGCVTAAGICPEGPFTNHSWDQVRKCFDVNITGTYFTAQLATKQMQAQGTNGSIVLIASISGSCATPGVRLSAYNASKGAVKMLNTALSVELAPWNIRVNAISPGFIDTDLLTPLKQQAPKRIELMRQEPPLKRIGNRNDLTPAIIYLLSDASPYTTGTEITIDGGITSGRIESPYI